MEFIAKFIGRILGPLFQVAGLVGSAIPASMQEGMLNAFLSYLAEPIFYIPSIVGGTLLTTWLWGELWAERKLKVAGGISGREFVANYQYWDRVANFPVWQISWLWNNLEPQNSTEPTEGTPAYPTFRWLKEQLDQGAISKVSKVDDSWLWTTIPRQQLIDYAFLGAERPRFLFPYERNSWPLNNLAQARFYSVNQATKMRTLSDLISFCLNYLNDDSIQKPSDIEEALSKIQNEKADEMAMLGYSASEAHKKYALATDMIRTSMWTGEWQAIARRKVDGLMFGYQVISTWKWEFAEVRYSSVDIGSEVYMDVRVKDVRKNPLPDFR